MLFRICAVLCNFYPRPPRGGRPVCFAAGRVSVSISIHALREEGDSSPIFKKVAILNFYPRPPRGGRRGVCAGIVAPELISIHALREEGDTVWVSANSRQFRFLSTPSARRATWGARREVWRQYIFLSTPSARRATDRGPDRAGGRRISIHALREEGDKQISAEQGRDWKISIHALREEGDVERKPQRLTEDISIHALREEGDPLDLWGLLPDQTFLSTPSARRATQASRI